MLLRAAQRHLLIDSEKFGRKGLVQAGKMATLDSIVVDKDPGPDLRAVMQRDQVEILVAG